MRLTLVDNMVLPEQGSLHLLDTHPHLGLLSLAATAGAAGHEVTIYDPKRLILNGELPYDETLYERVADDLLATRPDTVGFTTLGCSFLFVVGVGRALEHRAADLPLLLGGPHATMLAQQILERYPTFDVVVRHEAEQTLPAVLARLDTRNFADVPGVTWRTPTGVAETPGSPRIDDLDTLPWLDYDLYPMGDLDLRLLRVEAGRGCPFACTFCSTATFFQRRYRLKSPDRIVAEMDLLHERYAPQEFKLDHDLFTVDKRKVRAFCDVVEGHGHRWRVSARVDCLDEHLLEQMAAAGCVGMYLGIETGSARMQKIVAKRLDLNRVAPILDMCRHLSIETTASFITGYPEETEEDQNATLDLLGACFSRPAATCIPQLHLLTPEPGTALFDQLGGSMLFDGYATPFNSWLLRAQDRQEILDQPTIFASYYHYPATLARGVHVGVVECVDLLRKLDDVVLAALIHRHGRGMAGIVRDLLAASPASTPSGPAALERYVREWLGDDDPLTSAVRYGVFVAGGRPEAEAGPCHGRLDELGISDALLRMPPGMRILDNVHDCAEVVDWLKADGNPRCAASLPRYSYLWPSGSALPVRVDPGLVILLNLFERGRSWRDLSAELCDVEVRLPDGWFAGLLDAGLLIPADQQVLSDVG